MDLRGRKKKPEEEGGGDKRSDDGWGAATVLSSDSDEESDIQVVISHVPRPVMINLDSESSSDIEVVDGEDCSVVYESRSPRQAPEQRRRRSRAPDVAKPPPAEETSCDAPSSSETQVETSSGDSQSQPSSQEETQQMSLSDQLSEAQSGQTEPPSQPCPGQKESSSQSDQSQEMSASQTSTEKPGNNEPPRFEFKSPVDFLEMSSEEERQNAARWNVQNLEQVFKYLMHKQAEEEEAKKKAKAEKRAAAAAARKKAKEEEAKRLMISGPRRRSPRFEKKAEFFSNLNLIPASVSMTQQISKPSYTRRNTSSTTASSSGTLQADADASTSSIPEAIPGTSAQALKENSAPPAGPMQPAQKKKKRKSGALESPAASSPQPVMASNAKVTPAPAEPVASSSKNVPRRGGPSQLKRKEKCPLDNDAGWVEGDNWIVEKILDSRLESKDGVDETMYKVKWEGWGNEHNSWIKEDEFNGGSKVKSYWRKTLKKVKELNCPIRKVAVSREPTDSLYFEDY